jgi:hypothetical protein
MWSIDLITNEILVTPRGVHVWEVKVKEGN